MKKNALLFLVLVATAFVGFPGLNSTVWAQLQRKPALQKSQVKAVPAKPSKLPDLIVSDIKLIKDCKIQITIKNAGRGRVPDSGYHRTQGAGVQMYNGGKPWGGTRLFAVDPAKRLKKPGASVTHVWFPRAANLALGPGTHSIKVIVDNNNAVAELNEKNNSKTARLACKKPVSGREKGMRQKNGAKLPAGVQQAKTLQTQGAKLPASVRQGTTLQTQAPNLPAGAQQQIVVPDLVLSNFNVNQGARQQVNNAFDFPFSVLIRNTGTGDVKNVYDLSFQEYDDAHNRWGGENQPGVNCIRINRLLKSGESFPYTGTLRLLNYKISNQDLRVRAFVDSACSEEFPKTWRHVGEVNENNNYSNEVTITGGYHPHIGSITPNVCLKGSEQVMIGGMGFGSAQGSHTVKLRNGSFQIAANIAEWYDGVIYITVPSGAKIGINKVSIADGTSLQRYSNEVDLKICDTKVLAWSDLIAVWDLFNDAFKIELNTHGGGCSYNNTSKITLVQSTDINVPLIQFNYAGLKYRFLVRQMNSQQGGIILSKQGCGPNQLRMEISFESSGTELKGCNRALIKGASWCDGCVADIHINNGKMVIIFNFSATGGNLDFALSTNFSADVHASNDFADALMNLFLGNWNQDVRNNINSGVRAGLLASQNKNYILSEFDKLIKMLLGISGKQVTNIEFKADGIHVTYTI